MQSISHCASETIPQPKKPNHAIITDMMKAARNQVPTFRSMRSRDGLALIDDSNSMRRKSFIGLSPGSAH
jgi:hypothetical protein